MLAGRLDGTAAGLPGRLQVGIATDAGRDPAGAEPRYQPADPHRYPALPLPAKRLQWRNKHAADIALSVVGPLHRAASAVSAATHQHAHRAGFGQTADPAAIAGPALRRLAGCIRVNVNDAHPNLSQGVAALRANTRGRSGAQAISF